MIPEKTQHSTNKHQTKPPPQINHSVYRSTKEDYERIYDQLMTTVPQESADYTRRYRIGPNYRGQCGSALWSVARSLRYPEVRAIIWRARYSLCNARTKSPQRLFPSSPHFLYAAVPSHVINLTLSVCEVYSRPGLVRKEEKRWRNASTRCGNIDVMQF